MRGTLDDVRAKGTGAIVVELDVAVSAAVEDAAERIEAELGPIDVWVNNAMTSVFSPVHELTADEVRRVTEVTYLGYVNGTLCALRRMRPRARPIVQVGSALSYRSIPLPAAYCGAKHAIKGFTESLRCELLHDGSDVRVTMVQLPAVNTPQFEWVRTRLPGRPRPVPPIFQPEVPAKAIVWAATHAPRELKVGWPTVRAVFLNRVVPGMLAGPLSRQDRVQVRSRTIKAWIRTGGTTCSSPCRGIIAHGRFDDDSHADSRLLDARIVLGELISRRRSTRRGLGSDRSA